MSKKNINFLILALLLILAITGLFFVFSQNLNIEFRLSKAAPANKEFFDEDSALKVPDSDGDNDKDSDRLSPEVVKAIYLTSWSASRKDKIDYAINIAKTTEINAIVIDIKDFSGYVVYNTTLPEVIEYNARQIRIPNIDLLIERLHQEGIYVIGRITVFQDPILARARPDLAVHSKSKLIFSNQIPSPHTLWLDNLELAWIDPVSEEAWDYNIAIAKDTLNQGFDEINFDYVRFPSDGVLGDMHFPFWDGVTPRRLIIREFFKKVRQELPEVTLSVDLFGLTASVFNDLGVGQIIEDAFEYFDYICPMIYPSHYADGFLGYPNPAEYPYQVVKYSMDNALSRLRIYNLQEESVVYGKEKKREQKRKAQLRPWLQDFDLGAIYDVQMVMSEIRAVYDAAGDDFSGFMLWSSSNFYTKGALQRQ